MRVLVLVDGEHHPPVTRWAIENARASGHDVVAALFLGGSEKVSGPRPPDLGVETIAATGDLASALSAALSRFETDAVLDLSDEPILGYRERMELVSVTLARGVRYRGADFSFDPPVGGPPLPVPTVAVIGTGKRCGKTAVAGQLARTALASGIAEPFVVAAGRGGPPEPRRAAAGTVTVEDLADIAAVGDHAASDYLEDALTAGVDTVGARRAGGGLAGASFATNAREAADLAAEAGAGLVILEGSGSTVPPVPWDAGVLVVPARIPPEYLGGYLGPYRLLLSDLVVFTMAAGSRGPEDLSVLKSLVHRWREDAEFVVTDFEPVPLADVRGRKVFLTTTAPAAAAGEQVARLRHSAGCEVVGWSSNLADRRKLAEDLERQEENYEVLLTELKAAAVDVAARSALARGTEVVFLENRPVAVEEGPSVEDRLEAVIDLARKRRMSRP